RRLHRRLYWAALEVQPFTVVSATLSSRAAAVPMCYTPMTAVATTLIAGSGPETLYGGAGV
ncbi:hypothetical protein, partial [Dyella nitratireducens]|uniref:hypothetical protein n=1 Tax=Dyella nitratireducens TaxID=1849580 RepID=UPI0024E0EDF1